MAVTGRGRKFKAWLAKPRLAGQVNRAIRRVERFGATEDSGSAAFLDWIQVAADTPPAVSAPQRLGMWRPLALAALGLLATEDYAQAKAPDLHAYRASSAHGGVAVSYSHLVLVEAEQDAIRTDHNRRLLFGKSATVVPIVGAPWHLWDRKIPTQEAEEDAKRANHSLLHRYRTGYQTVGQPFSAWPKAQQRVGDEEFSLPKRVDLTPFRQPLAAQVVGAPWWCLWQKPAPRTDEEEFRPAKQADVFSFKAAEQVPPLQGPADQTPVAYSNLVLVEAEQDAIRQDHSRRLLFGKAPPIAPVAGAPWYLWPKEKPRTDGEEFAPKKPIELLAFQRIAYVPPLQGPADQTPVAFSQLVLIEAEQDAVRTDHNRRILFGRGEVVAPPQAQNLFAGAPVQIPGEEDFELLPAKPTLHLFRSPPAEAVPGQPFLIWPKAQARIEAEEQETRRPVDLSPYRWPTVTPSDARAPWYLWNRTTLRIAEEEYTVPQPSQFALSRAIGGPFQSGYVTAPVHIPGEEEFLVLPDAPNVHRFRQIMVVVPRGTPLWFWPPAIADQTIEPNPVVTDHALALYPFRPHDAIPPVVAPDKVHGFEIVPEHGRKGDRTRRGLVTIIEDGGKQEAKSERKTITKRDIDHRRFEQARERALEIIADAAQQHAKATKPESQRFASVRMSLKPLVKPLGGWNWISVYQRLYQAALLDAIKNELAIQDGIDEEGAIIAMLMEML